MTQQPFNNESSQDKRREVFENEKRLREQQQQGSTYLGFTHTDIGGRFGGTDLGKETVIGRDAPNYPAGPSWCAGDQGLEAPLGVDINEMQPTGEVFEVAASLERLGATGFPSGQPDGDSEERRGGPPDDAAQTTPSPPTSSTDDEPPRAA